MGCPSRTIGKFMKICLITPPSIFLLDERVFVSLGILKVAASLERSGHIVEVLDLSGIENYEEVTKDHAKQTDAEVFGITATTPQMPAAFKIRKALGTKRVILGGPHATLVHAAYRGEKRRGINGRATEAMSTLTENFDVIVAGDGESAVLKAIQKDAPKLIDADSLASVDFLTNEALTASAFPARHLVDMDSYHYSIDGERATSLICQLGCPFGCGFCGGRESMMLRKIRTRTSENVVKEIENLYRTYNIKGFMLYDDELNVNPKMVELMDMIYAKQKELECKFRLRGFIKSQLFTDAQSEAMARAGFKWILVGFESGSPRILDNIEKRATVEQNSRCMAIARRHGLKVKALMSIGHPGESEHTIKKTKEWLLKEKPDDFDVTVISTYPGTSYYDKATETSPGVWTYQYKNGDRLHSIEVDYTQTADYYKGSPDGGYKSYVYTDYLSPESLVKLRDDLERDVRSILGIPFNPGAPGKRYEASMGMIPGYILRQSQSQVTA